MIVGADGRQAVSESFRYTRGYWRRFTTSYGAALALLLAVAWTAGRQRPRDGASPGYWVTLFALVALVASLPYLAFDRFAWSRSYLYQERNPNAPAPPELLVSLESGRQAVLRGAHDRRTRSAGR